MNHHHVKILSEHFNNVKSGTKTFEIRKNDRAYQKGDLITLYQWDQKDQKYLSGELFFKIGDVYPIDAERVVFSLLKMEDGNG